MPFLIDEGLVQCLLCSPVLLMGGALYQERLNAVPTFLRRPPTDHGGHHVYEQRVGMQQRDPRNLRLLAAGVGAGFRQRALAPVLLYVLLMGVVLIAAWLGHGYWPQFAPLVLLLCGVLLGRVRQVRRRWLGAYLLAVVLLLLLQSPWSGLAPAGVERVAIVAMALGLAQLVVHTGRVLRFARALQSQVDELDDAAILAMLPPEAAEDARQWLGGDDRKAPELGEVVNLSVLYAALQSPGTRRSDLRRILMG